MLQENQKLLNRVRVEGIASRGERRGPGKGGPANFEGGQVLVDWLPWMEVVSYFCTWRWWGGYFFGCVHQTKECGRRFER